MQKKITIQYLIGVGLALLIIPIVEGALAVLPNIGWHFLTVMYITVFNFANHLLLLDNKLQIWLDGFEFYFEQKRS